jgi:hypothetical protein
MFANIGNFWCTCETAKKLLKCPGVWHIPGFARAKHEVFVKRKLTEKIEILEKRNQQHVNNDHHEVPWNRICAPAVRR